MCIRYIIGGERLSNWSAGVDAFLDDEVWKGELDMFPGSEGPILLPDAERGDRIITRARWGAMPFWTKDEKYGRKNAYNARSETLLEKPTWRQSFKERRCVIPAEGFFERIGVGSPDGRWVRFETTDDLLAIAGLYEEPNKLSDMVTYAMVTTDPNEQVAEIHDRMPVLLSKADIDRWLDPDAHVNELRAMLQPAPPEWTRTEDAGPIRVPKASPPSLFD